MGVFDAFAPRVATKLFSALLLAGFAVLVAARLPLVWLRGRFWGEEGAVYFHNAWNLPWPDALFAVHTGYLNLSASIATLLAVHLVPLAAAPWVSTGFAWLIQLCPAALLLTGQVPWLRERWTQALALLLLLPVASSEVWLNSITSQFHLGLCACLILALPTCNGPTGAFRFGLLALGPLSGPASVFTTPLFVLRALMDRSRVRALQAGVLAVGSVAQMAMVFLHPEPARALGIGPRLLGLVVYVKHVLLPLLGADATAAFTGDIIARVQGGEMPWGGFAIAVAASVAMALAAWSTRRPEIRWMLAGGAWVMVLSYVGALGPHLNLLGASYGDRYDYIPAVLFGLVLLGCALCAPVWVRPACAMLVLWIVVVALREYVVTDTLMGRGPAWSGEVARWRADPAYRVQFWPEYPFWRFNLGAPATAHGG